VSGFGGISAGDREGAERMVSQAPVPLDAMPVSNPWSQWVEICKARDLEIYSCPTCLKEIPDFFMMFRPMGLEFWRCLGCMAQTQRAGALHLARTTTNGDAADDLDGVPY